MESGICMCKYWVESGVCIIAVHRMWDHYLSSAWEIEFVCE